MRARTENLHRARRRGHDRIELSIDSSPSARFSRSPPTLEHALGSDGNGGVDGENTLEHDSHGIDRLNACVGNARVDVEHS